jgi:hypothetical protein
MSALADQGKREVDYEYPEKTPATHQAPTNPEQQSRLTYRRPNTKSIELVRVNAQLDLFNV